jgi:hypothetical protein
VIDLPEFIREISENGRENHEQIKCCRCCACCSQVGTRHLLYACVCARACTHLVLALGDFFHESGGLAQWLLGAGNP